MNRPNQGMSLVEVTLVMIILSLVASVGIESLHHYRLRLKLEAVSGQLMTFLFSVQQKANWSNKSYRIASHTHSNQVRLQVIDLFSHRQLDGFSFTSSENAVSLHPYALQSPIGFHGRRNMASAGHLIVSNAQGQIKIIVSANGRIRRCTYSSSERQAPIMGISLC